MHTRQWALWGGVLLSLAFARAASAALPTPDHVVIVIEENHSAQSILGNAGAPFINNLATSGLSFDNFYAIAHPSQPNYLQLFSGSNQGVLTDDTPASGLPFTTPNLAASLVGAGYSFGGYSQSQPSVGFTGDSYTPSTAVPPLKQYYRK